MAPVRCAQFTLYRVYIMVTHSMSKGLDELKTANTFPPFNCAESDPVA